MVKILLYILLLISFAAAQENEISSKKDELINLRSEIKRLEDEIKSKSRTERKTFETLEALKKQAYVLNRMVNTLRKEEEQKGAEIGKTAGEIRSLEKRINLLKESYARSIKGLYKYGTPSDIELFLNSDNLNQVLVRKKYLQRFSEKRKSDLDHLEKDIDKLSQLRDKLEKERKEKALLADAKQKEESNLKVKMNESSRLISEIKKNKSELKKEIDARKKAEVKIASMIEKLIAEAERKKREEAERLARLNSEKNTKETIKKEPSFDIDLSTEGFTSFKNMRGGSTGLCRMVK
jgi:murein hydrolase activator